MKLVDEWRHFYKWSQTWLITTISVAPLLYDQFEALRAVLPAQAFKIGMATLGVMTLINTVRQKKPVA